MAEDQWASQEWRWRCGGALKDGGGARVREGLVWGEVREEYIVGKRDEVGGWI